METPNTPTEPTRATERIVFVGKPNTGKTTVIRRLVRQQLQLGRRVLVVTPHDNEWTDLPDVHPRYLERINKYKGARRLVCIAEKEIIDFVAKNYKHGLLVLDDCRAYVPDTIDICIKSMLIGSRQNDVDIMAVGHGFTTVPPIFFTYATKFCIFATTDKVDRRKNCVMNYPAIESAVKRINEQALSNPHYFEFIPNL